jgi:hypothetical protein
LQGIYEWRQCCFHLTDLEDIHSYWKEAKYGKRVRKDGIPWNFWKELGKKKSKSRMLVTLMKTYMKQGMSQEAGR